MDWLLIFNFLQEYGGLKKVLWGNFSFRYEISSEVYSIEVSLYYELLND